MDGWYGKAGMKAIEYMSIKELQKSCDDSLFSPMAWLPAQIHFRECLRHHIVAEVKVQAVVLTQTLLASGALK